MARPKNITTVSAGEFSSDYQDDDRKYRAPALEKGLDILELLARSQGPLTTSQMAVSLGRSVSELFRMVLALEYRGYIAPGIESREGYLLTNKLFTLGIAQGTAKSLLDAALPEMKELSRDLGQSCHLVVASGNQIVVVARFESPMDVGFSVRVGYRRPAIEASSGAVLYGFASNEERKAWYPVVTEGASQSEIERFLAKAESVKAKGYAQYPSDFVDGVTDFCLPIFSQRGVAATLTVPHISIKSKTASADQVIARVRLATERISNALIDEGR